MGQIQTPVNFPRTKGIPNQIEIESCASPKKLKENGWSLKEKQMRHRHNSACALQDHNEPSMTVVNPNSNSGRWRQNMDAVVFPEDGYPIHSSYRLAAWCSDQLAE
jgi:hypothetical protein